MQTRRFLPTAGVAAVLALLSAPDHAVSQVHRYGIGWTAGAGYMTELNANPLPGYEADPRQVSPGLGYTLGLHVEKWNGGSGRFALRAQGSFQQPRVDMAWRGQRRAVNAFSGDVSMLFRLLSPKREGAVLPYLMVGGGAGWFDMGAATALVGADASYDGQPSPLPIMTFGLGADTPSVGRWDNDRLRIRFELADHLLLRSPLRRTSDWQRHGSVHQLRFTIGVYSATGSVR